MDSTRFAPRTDIQPEKIEELIRQIADDQEFRDRFQADPNAILQELNVEPLATPPDRIIVRDDKSDVLLLWESREDALDAVETVHKWPRRYYYLENRTDRTLNLETWATVYGIRIQDQAVAVKSNEITSFSSVTSTELFLNKCNLDSGSFLVRDNTNGKVLAESHTVTCGDIVNRWTATGKGDQIVCTESHPKE